MISSDAKNLWKKLYLLTGTNFTIEDVNKYINKNPTGGHLGYPASAITELGYIEPTQFMSYQEYRFTEKFINEIEGEY